MRRPSRIPWDLPALALDPPGFLLRRATARGPVATLRLGPRPAYVVSGPAEAQQVLTDHRHLPKGLAHDPADPEPGPPLALAFGNGLLSSSGRHHARQRRLMQPTLRPGSVAGYADRMFEESERASETWRDGDRIDLAPALSELTLRILTRTIFETPLSPRDSRDIRSAVRAGQQLAGLRALIRVRRPAGSASLEVQAAAAMGPARAVIARMIQDRARVDHQPDGGSPRRSDLLSLLLAAVDEDSGEQMSAGDVEDEVLTLLLAGHETTTNALSWTFALLGRHPLAQARLHAELDAAGAAGTTPLALADLPWLAACVDESMRLYPPAWAILRHTDQATRIGSVEVPAGSTLVVSPFAAHRIPALWASPDRFDPARFAPGGTAYPARRRPPSGFLPFGGGPRLCIGEHFALLEARIVLATLARHWRVIPAGRRFPAYRPGITLGPRGGLPVRLERR